MRFNFALVVKNEKNKNIYIYTLIILAFVKSIIEIFLNLKEMEVSQATNSIWGSIFILLTILWVYYDADRPDFKKPFDFGFIVYVFWPIALPWYLITTRGLDGILIFFWFHLVMVGALASRFSCICVLHIKQLTSELSRSLSLAGTLIARRGALILLQACMMPQS